MMKMNMSGGPPPGYMEVSWGMNGGMAGMPNHGAAQGIASPGVAANHGAVHGSSGLFGSGGDLGSLLGGVLNLAFELIALLLVIGLIAGSIIFIKRYLFEGGLFELKSREVCSCCGKVLNSKWNNCPSCGQSKVLKQQTV